MGVSLLALTARFILLILPSRWYAAPVFSEALTVTATALENRRVIRDACVQVRSLLTQGHIRVVVFGSAGAGKSTLGGLLAGQEPSVEYRESTQIERYRLKGRFMVFGARPTGPEGSQAIDLE